MVDVNATWELYKNDIAAIGQQIPMYQQQLEMEAQAVVMEAAVALEEAKNMYVTNETIDLIN